MVLSVTGHANDNFQAGSMHHLLGYLSAAMTIMVIMMQDFPTLLKTCNVNLIGK